MLKILSFLTRRADFTLPAFSEYWRTTHKAHALKLVEAGFIRGYIQNHRVGDDPAGDLPGLPLLADGAPELWVEDADALQRLVASREYLEGAGPDEANFVMPPVLAAVAHEHVIVGGVPPAGAVKLMLVARRAPQLPMAEFSARWLEPRQPLAMPAASPLRLTRHLPVADDGPFHGIEFSWWPDLQALRIAWSRREPPVLGRLVDAESLAGLVVREEVVIAAPDPATERGAA